MPSLALKRWRKERTASLNEIENVHRSVAGVGVPKRAAMQQLKQAYTLLLSSEFQGFCRDLPTDVPTPAPAYCRPPVYRT